MIKKHHLPHLLASSFVLSIGASLMLWNANDPSRFPASIKVVEKEKIVEKVVEKEVKVEVEKIVKVPVEASPPEKEQYYFYYEKDDLVQESQDRMDQIIADLKTMPNARFEIHAYTDNIGTDKYNYYLSKKRANAILKLLKDKGVDYKKVGLYYHGIDPQNNETIEGRQKNRRVDFLIYNNEVQQ
jgi:outer membrane protein OmpA-like peptidoglycan-associated protein